MNENDELIKIKIKCLVFGSIAEYIFDVMNNYEEKTTIAVSLFHDHYFKL